MVTHKWELRCYSIRVDTKKQVHDLGSFFTVPEIYQAVFFSLLEHTFCKFICKLHNQFVVYESVLSLKTVASYLLLSENFQHTA